MKTFMLSGNNNALNRNNITDYKSEKDIEQGKRTPEQEKLMLKK